MKKIQRITIPIAIILTILSSCGKIANPIIDELTPNNLITDNIIENNIDETKNTMPIEWGWGYLFMGDYTIPSHALVLEHMNQKFNVRLTMKLYGKDKVGKVLPPDIYPNYDRNAYASDTIRAIPQDMIEQYAPRYASLLTQTPFGWDMYKVSNQDAYYGLVMYDNTYAELKDYSVYRLDWLEAQDIEPNTPPVKIYDNIYFSEQAFTQTQFTSIMHAFSGLSANGVKTHGMAIPHEAALFQRITNTLLGMWGRNNNSLLFFADDSYKECLRFLKDLYATDAITLTEGDYTTYANEVNQGRVGWWTHNILGIANINISNFDQLLINEPNAKLLVTPPEIGNSNNQGVMAATTMHFNKECYWSVNANVSDEKLAKLLTMFDELAFDRDTWLLARYGYEGDTFNWEGEPYESRALQSQDQWLTSLNEGAYALNTYIYDGEAGQQLYSIGSNALTDFAKSEIGRRMVIFPHKDDVTGTLAEHNAVITKQYYEGIYAVIQSFYLSAILGQIDIDAGWDTYLVEMEANGLNEYRKMMEELPTFMN